MARTTSYALRIPEEDASLLESLAASRKDWSGIPQRPSEYLRRLVLRHLRRIRRNRERKEQVGLSDWQKGEPAPDSPCLCGAMTYAKGPVPVIRADAVEEQAND